MTGPVRGAGIACNVIAGHHRDNLYLPRGDAARALEVLRAAAGI